MQLKLLCVLAHPDDESLGIGGTLAKYAAEGVEVSLITATRGERGWFGRPADNPGHHALGAIREQELRAAASQLNIHELQLLDYIDGELDSADPTVATAKIAAHIRRIRPQVVITFSPDGSYGHPDHIAISQLATAATISAAAAAGPDGLPPHRTDKLYYLVASRELITLYRALLGNISIAVDGSTRNPVEWQDWMITTRIDSGDYWRSAWNAIACHRTQLPNLSVLKRLPEELHQRLWGVQTYYRAFSTVNGGRALESDLFAGLR